ncbi:MAG TPA: DinB family protein [Chthoniobacterales bacterium]
MSNAVADPVPSLGPPGAGLPKAELFIARLMLNWQARRSTRTSTAALFAGERTKILDLARSCRPEEGCRRVLIKRLRGLEDSSRYWSVFMTLDHLRIVNRQVAEVIRLLGRGETPAFVASTARVKPRVEVDEKVVEEFQAACEHFEECVAGVENLRTQVRFAHPWFGPLDAAGWHFTAFFHLRLHRHQIEAIRRARPVIEGKV